MRKIFRQLTQEQIDRGVVFTSTLSNSKTEQPDDITHEVHKDDPDKYLKIERLEDIRGFHDSPWKYNIIRRNYPKGTKEV